MDLILNKLFAQASINPDKIAVRSGSESFSYHKLCRDIEHVAESLKIQSIQRLGLALDNSVEWIVIDLACALAKIVVIPLPHFFSDSQLCHASKDGAVDAIASRGGLSGQGSIRGSCSNLYADSNINLLKFQPRDSRNDSKYLTKVSYTSGTTGAPRGIPLDGWLIDQVCCSINELTTDLDIVRHLSVLPYSTLLENIGGIYAALSQGKTVYAESSRELGLSLTLDIDGAQFSDTFNRIQPNSLILTPQVLDQLCSLVENDQISTNSLKFVAVGGARAGKRIHERAQLAGIPVYEGYGLTEIGSVAMVNTPDDNRPGSVGKPLNHIRARIADDGEIVLSAGVSGSDEQLEVVTGDLGHIDEDGFVFVDGRKKNLIVLSTGRNVSPEWIEAELNSILEIRNSFVFGEGLSDLSAVIITTDDSVSNESLNNAIKELNQRLPAYARIIRWYRQNEIPGPSQEINYRLLETLRF